MTELSLVVNFVGGDQISVDIPTGRRKETAEWLMTQMQTGSMTIFKDPGGSICAAGRGTLISSFKFETSSQAAMISSEIGEINALHLRRLRAEVKLAERAVSRLDDGNEWKS